MNASDGDIEARLVALQTEHRVAEAAVRDDERRLEEIKDGVAELLRDAAVTRGRLGDLAGEHAEREERLAAIARETPALVSAVDNAQAALAIAENGGRAWRDELARRETERHEGEAKLYHLRAALEQSALRIAAARETRNQAARAARRILPGGAGERLRAVLESLNGDRPAAPPAMLLDVMKAPPALEPALRAVLGDQLEAVITDSPHFALRAIEVLKQHESGRLSFIPRTLDAAGGTHHAIDAPGIAGRLLEMVEVEPRFTPLAEALMGHVMLANDLRSAYAASNLNGRGTVFVTRDGDVLAPDRMISGGSGGAQADSAEAIGMRQRALALEVAERVVIEAEADHEELTRRVEWARLAVADELEALRDIRTRLAECDGAVTAARTAIAQAEQRLALLEANRAAAQRRVEEIAQLALAANQRLEDLARAEQAARARLAHALDALSGRRAAAKNLGEAMLELGARVAAHKAARIALQQDYRHQRAIAETLDGELQRADEELARAAHERAEFERESAALAAQDAAALVHRDEFEAARAALHLRCQAGEHELEGARAALKLARERAAAIAAEGTQCQLRRERAGTLAEELARGFAEKFAAAFDSVADELRVRLADRDPAADAARLQELRARAEKIGEVNLAAESEVKELEERAGHLTAERDDLQAAANDLAHTIQKLNREARKRFSETFEGAARNFGELFPKLMRGGKGRLELAAADDVLEAGVNILVQPAGKKVKELALLSGGEKALSAMALIFSLFLLNPSPFCVMDEVDAPLDEFSLAAFTGLVRELKARSQFIIITHNQRTMQAADHIHGVTMERPGISRIISLEIPRAA
jgi:chromosome segregation protein